MKSLAQRFKEALLAANVYKKELADAVGISPSAVTQIANGETKELKASVALKIARKLNVDPWWLVLGEGDMQLPEGTQLEEAQSLLKQMPASNLTAVTTILKQLSEINKI